MTSILVTCEGNVGDGSKSHTSASPAAPRENPARPRRHGDEEAILFVGLVASRANALSSQMSGLMVFAQSREAHEEDMLHELRSGRTGLDSRGAAGIAEVLQLLNHL